MLVRTFVGCLVSRFGLLFIWENEKLKSVVYFEMLNNNLFVLQNSLIFIEKFHCDNLIKNIIFYTSLRRMSGNAIRELKR